LVATEAAVLLVVSLLASVCNWLQPWVVALA